MADWVSGSWLISPGDLHWPATRVATDPKPALAPEAAASGGITEATGSASGVGTATGEGLNARVPTFVSETEGTWNSVSTPQNLSVTVQTGDLIVVIAAAENADAALSISGGGLTWTPQQTHDNDDVHYPLCVVWTAIATSNTTFNVALACVGGQTFSGNALVFRNHGGVGVSNQANNSSGSGAPSVSLTVAAHSAIAIIVSDWNATTGGTTWLTNAGTFTELSNYADGTTYGVHGGYHADAPAGTLTLGMSAPATQRYGIIAVEILVAATSGITEGTGAAAGAGAATGVSGAIAKGDGASTGVATPTGVGASRNLTTGSAAGVATPTGVGGYIIAAVGSAAGTVAPNAIAAATAVVTGAAGGSGLATGASISFNLATGGGTGVATTAGVAASLALATGSAEGVAAVAGIGEVVGSGADGSAAGNASASGVGAAIVSATGSAASSATSTTASAATILGVGSSAGNSTATGESQAFFAAIGNSTGTGTANGEGDTIFPDPGSDGAAAGSATVTGTASAIVSAEATAAGVAEVTGFSPETAPPEDVGYRSAWTANPRRRERDKPRRILAAATGTAAGTSTATGIGESFMRVVVTPLPPFAPAPPTFRPALAAALSARPVTFVVGAPSPLAPTRGQPEEETLALLLLEL